MTEEQFESLMMYIDARFEAERDPSWGAASLRETEALGNLRNSFGLSYHNDGSGPFWGGEYAQRKGRQQ